MKFTFDVYYYNEDENTFWSKPSVKKINAKTAEEAEAKFRKRFPDKKFAFVNTYKNPFTFLGWCEW